MRISDWSSDVCSSDLGGSREPSALRFATPDGEATMHADAVVFALGGGSWPQLGSDGAWQGALRERGLDVAPLQPANCGFDIGWSEHFAGRHASAPLKRSEEHTSELQSLMRISYAVFCLKKKNT